jgi:YVTN family beta-propeller protein
MVMLFALSSFAGCGSTMNGSGGNYGYNTNGSGGGNASAANSGGRSSGAVSGAGGTGENTSPSPKAYVGLFGDDAVAVVDLAAAKVISTIAVSAPDGLVIRPDGAKVYVSSNSSNVVDVIDTATDTMKAAIEVGTQPAGLSITADGRYVVVSVQGDGQVAIIDTTTDAVISKASVGKAHNSGISADGARAFIASQVASAPSVDVLDVPSASEGRAFALDAAPRALCELAGKVFATVTGSADIEVLDAMSGQKTASIPTGGSPHDIRPTVDGAYVLTVSQTAGELEFVDPQTSSVVGHVPTGKMPHWIGLSSDGADAYVTNEGDGNLVIVDLAARSVQKTIAVGNAPRKIAVMP